MAATTADRDPALRPDEVAIAQYRSVSRLALLSVGLGVLAALGLANPLFLPIGLAAIVAAVVALRSIRASGGQLIGSWLAIVGLCLGSLFLGWCLSRSFSRQAALEGQARAVAEGWLKLVAAGDRRQAHQFTVSSDRRAFGRAALARLYASDVGAVEDLQKWFSQEPLKAFAALAPNVGYRYDSIADTGVSVGADTLTLKYFFHPKDKPEELQPMWIWLRRDSATAALPADWKVMAVAPRPPE